MKTNREITVAAFNFNQKRYMENVFRFIDQNDITIREFCEMSGVSAATLYRARDSGRPMDIQTIRKLDAAIAEYLAEEI